MSKNPTLTPLTGKALVQLLMVSQQNPYIIIPQTANVRRKCEAKLLAFTQPRDHKFRVDLEEAMKADAVVILKPFAGTQPFTFNEQENLCIVQIADIEAWSPKPLEVTASEHSDGAVPRCHFCGPACPGKSSNAMLMVDGPEGYYCPRCLKNKHGKVIDPDAVTLTEEEERRGI